MVIPVSSPTMRYGDLLAKSRNFLSPFYLATLLGMIPFKFFKQLNAS